MSTTLKSDQTPSALHSDVAGEVSGLSEKVTPVSADVLVLEDSAASYGKKKVQVGNLPGCLVASARIVLPSDWYIPGNTTDLTLQPDSGGAALVTLGGTSTGFIYTRTYKAGEIVRVSLASAVARPGGTGYNACTAAFVDGTFIVPLVYVGFSSNYWCNASWGCLLPAMTAGVHVIKIAVGTDAPSNTYYEFPGSLGALGNQGACMSVEVFAPPA